MRSETSSLRRERPALPAKVVFCRAALVAVPLDRDLHRRILLQHSGVGLQDLLAGGIDIRAIEREEHRLERGVAIQIVDGRGQQVVLRRHRRHRHRFAHRLRWGRRGRIRVASHGRRRRHRPRDRRLRLALARGDRDRHQENQNQQRFGLSSHTHRLTRTRTLNPFEPNLWNPWNLCNRWNLVLLRPMRHRVVAFLGDLAQVLAVAIDREDLTAARAR